MSDSSIHIGWCPRARVADLQQFIDQYWRRGHVLARDAELLLWQHARPGNPEELSILIGEDGGRIVGMLGVIACPFNNRSAIGSAAWLTTWVVSPEPRYRGLGLELLERVLGERYSFAGTLGANDQALRIYGLLRFHVRSKVQRWVRGGSETQLRSLLADAPMRHGPADIAALVLPARGGSAGGDCGRISVVNFDDGNGEHWDHAWRERFAPRLISIDKSAEYVRWRYTRHPRLNYVVRIVFDAERRAAVGLVVYRIVQVQGRSERILRIVELICDPHGESAAIQEIESAASRYDVAMTDFYCTTSRFSGMLEAAGFVEESNLSVPLPSLFAPLDHRRAFMTAAFSIRQDLGDNRDFFAGNDVYFTRADCDQDRPN